MSDSEALQQTQTRPHVSGDLFFILQLIRGEIYADLSNTFHVAVRLFSNRSDPRWLQNVATKKQAQKLRRISNIKCCLLCTIMVSNSSDVLVENSTQNIQENTVILRSVLETISQYLPEIRKQENSFLALSIQYRVLSRCIKKPY